MAVDYHLVDRVSIGVVSEPPPLERPPRSLSLGRIIACGVSAAHGALVGALFLFLLHIPGQVLGAVTQHYQAAMTGQPGKAPDATLMILNLVLSGAVLLISLGVLFLFPLVQGGILGQVRDRLESPRQPPGPFGAYARACYLRLLGSMGLYMAAAFCILMPVLCLVMFVTFQEVAALASAEGNTPQDFQYVTGHWLLFHSWMLMGLMVIACLLTSAMALVYWIASCVLVAERGGVLASWRKAIRFCWDNLGAVLTVWLLAVGIWVVMAPLGLISQLQIVTELSVLLPLAVANAALIGYVGVLLMGVCMSLYLGRRASPCCAEVEHP